MGTSCCPAGTWLFLLAVKQPSLAHYCFFGNLWAGNSALSGGLRAFMDAAGILDKNNAH